MIDGNRRTPLEYVRARLVALSVSSTPDRGCLAMKKGVFSSEDLGPADLDESRKFKLWHDLYQANFGSRDFMRAPDRKFRARFEFAQFGLIGLGAFDSTINYAARTAHDVRVDRKDA